MNILSIKQLFVAVLLVGFIAPLHAAIAVIVNPENPQILDEKQVRSAYLGKLKTFNDGEEVRPYDLPAKSEVYETFVKKVLRKTPSTLNAYWARVLFSSKGKPPRTLQTQEEVLHEVATRKNAIGYIDSGLVDSSVKVLFVIDED